MMTSISENIQKITRELPETVKLVAVSKTKPVAAIKEAYLAGQRIFGENRVQELLSKQPELPGDIQWHMIGHLQSNKVKFLVPFVSMIESVDTVKLLSIISKEAMKIDRNIDVLLQVHIAEEDTKFGFNQEELIQLLKTDNPKEWKGVRIRGLMGMATFTQDMDQVRREFRSLSGLFEVIKNQYLRDDEYFCEISMGMSNDYLTAIGEGSTMIRIGSGIFGNRE